MREEIYDAVIVGAGPAGSTCARLLARGGMKILIVDGQTDKNAKPCGGLLAPDAQKALAGFDLCLPKDVLVDPQIFSVKTIDLQAGLVRYYSRFYVNVDRRKFDSWLLSLVPDTAAKLSARCVEARRCAEGFRLLLRRNDGVEAECFCRTLIGADGAGSIVRRSFFPNGIMRYVAIQQWFTAGKDCSPFYSCVFDPATSESCSWSISKDGYFIYGGSFLPKNCRAMFEEQKRRAQGKYGFSFGECVKTEACMVCRPRRMKDFETGRDGVFLIGEAAGFISPSSFEGISSAILSGKFLAEAMLKNRASAERLYRRSTLGLRLKLYLKTYKRLFMYVPFLRRAVMRSGLMSIGVDISQHKQ